MNLLYRGFDLWSDIDSSGFYVAIGYLLTNLNLKINKFFTKLNILALAVVLIAGGVFVYGLPAEAAHTHVADITPELTIGNDATVYTINVSNDITSSHAIYWVKIQKPADYGNVTCGAAPADWALADSDNVQCTYSTPVGGSRIAVGGNKDFTLTSTTPGVSNTYTWEVKTKDTDEVVATTNPTTDVDAVAPTVAASDIVIDNTIQPNTITVVFSEGVIEALAEDTGNWTATNNGEGISYDIATAALDEDGKTVTLTLVATDPTDDTTFITNTDADAHIKVTPGAAITDLAGNAYAAGAVTEAGATHVKDDTAPTLTSVSIASNNANTSYAKTGDTVTISFTSSELIIEPAVADVQIDGNNADAVNCTPGVTTSVCTATRVMQAGDTEQPVAFTIDFADVAGVSGTQVTAVTDDSSVTYDETAPTTNGAIQAGTLGENDWYTSNITYRITPADALAGVYITYYCVDTADTCDPSLGTSVLGEGVIDVTVDTESATNYVRWLSADNASNAQSVQTSGALKIDKTNPTVGAGDDQTKYSLFTQTGTATDVLAGIDGATYQWAEVSGPGTITFGSATALETTISADIPGAYVISFTADDLAGNSANDTMNLVWRSTTIGAVKWSPAEGALNVAIASGTATVTFDSDITAIYDASKIDIVNDTTDVSVKDSVSIDDGKLLVNYVALTNSTTYRISIGANALNDVNGLMNGAETSTFTTVAQNAPVVTITAPVAGSTVSGEVDIIATNGTEYRIDNGDWTAIATPWDTTGLDDGTPHLIIARGGDPLGYSDAIAVLVDNTPPDETAPTVESVFPADEADDADIDVLIEVNFDEYMDHSTITPDNVKLFNESDEPVILDGIIALDYSGDGVSQTGVSLVPLSALDYGTEYYVTITTDVTDLAGNPFAGWVKGDYSFTTATEEVVELAVMHIARLKTTATADNTYANGWSWEFEVRVPTDENSLKMRFDDWTLSGGEDTIEVGGNMRIYSAQSSNAADAENAITLPASSEGEGEWSDPLLLTGDMDDIAGRQIMITVEMKIPEGSTAGSYSTSYALESLEAAPE